MKNLDIKTCGFQIMPGYQDIRLSNHARISKHLVIEAPVIEALIIEAPVIKAPVIQSSSY